MSSPLGVDQELLLSYTQNDTKNFNATIEIGGSEGYEFTVISIATSVLLGVMTLTTIIGRNIIIKFRYSEKALEIDPMFTYNLTLLQVILFEINCVIFLLAFYLIIWLMESPKNFEKTSILKI